MVNNSFWRQAKTTRKTRIDDKLNPKIWSIWHPKRNWDSRSTVSNPSCYQNNPGFKQMIQRTGVVFQSHPAFKKADLEQRFGMYQSIADRLWSIERLRGRDSE